MQNSREELVMVSSSSGRRRRRRRRRLDELEQRLLLINGIYLARARWAFIAVSNVQFVGILLYGLFVSQKVHDQMLHKNSQNVILINEVILGALSLLTALWSEIITTLLFVIFALCQMVTLVVGFHLYRWPVITITNLIGLSTAVIVFALLLWRHNTETVLGSVQTRPTHSPSPFAPFVGILNFQHQTHIATAATTGPPPPTYEEVTNHPERYPMPFGDPLPEYRTVCSTISDTVWSY